MNKNLIIRADADTHMGTGHVMRCIALAQAWQDSGGQVFFITACESDGLLQRLSNEGFQVVTLGQSYPDPADWEATSQVLGAHPDAWVVLDGYHFDEAYQKQVKKAGHRLLVIDDMAHLEHYCADIVLNQNLHAEQLNYSCEPYTQLLLGTQYAVLRREFLKWRNWKREIPEVARKVLVTLGGGDPDNVTFKVIRAINRLELEDLEVKVVIGPSNPHMASLKEAVHHSPFTIHLLASVENMAELMAWADVAISGGGSTCWEMAFMGLPNLVVVLADNQWPVAEQLDTAGAAVNLGWFENLSSSQIVQTLARLLKSSDRWAEMAQRGRGVVDGEGNARILTRLRGQGLRLRQVREEDLELLWEWANDREVRTAAFSPEPIPWEEHVQWFRRKLREPTCFLFIALDDQNTPIGQVRFEIDEGEDANIDVSIDRSKRRSGHGALLISKAVEEVFRVAPVETVHAFIKPHNEGSIRAFEKAGFRKLGIENVKRNAAMHYVRSRNDAQ